LERSPVLQLKKKKLLRVLGNLTETSEIAAALRWYNKEGLVSMAPLNFHMEVI
jgi:hypothetical protein